MDALSVGSAATIASTVSSNASDVKPQRGLVSAKWDLSRFKQPELTWDFYNSYHKSKPVKAARANLTNSIEGDNLDILFKRAILKEGKSALEAFLEATSAVQVSPYPPPFDELVPLQDFEGKWHDLEAVLRILNLPKSYSLDRCPTVWEQATAFALAAIRQRLDLFNLLHETHDKARGWMGSGEFIYQARDLMLMAQITRSVSNGALDEDSDLLKVERHAMLSPEEAKALEDQQWAEEAALYGAKFTVPALHVAEDKVETFFLPRPPITKLSFLQSNLVEDTSEGIEVKQTESVISSSESYLAQMKQVGVDASSDVAGSGPGAGENAPKVEGETEGGAVERDLVDDNCLHDLGTSSTSSPQPPETADDPLPTAAIDATTATTPRFRDEEERSRRNGPFTLPPDSPPMPMLSYVSASQEQVNSNRVSWGLVTEEPQKDVRPSSPSLESPSSPSSPSSPATSPGPSFDSLKSRLQAISPQKDPKRIAKTKAEMEAVQISLIDAAVRVDAHVDQAHCVLLDAVEHFNTCITYEERNESFELLTTMLGDDCPAREGFLDWRSKDTPGLRPLVLDFFSLVHRLAELRLLLEELETPGGRNVKPGADAVYDQNRYRWTFMYNGVDVVLKVMHCCDFLRRCKEFCNNYGKKFFFTGNPLMLPFDMLRALDIPEMRDKVQEQLSTRAHVRPAYSFGDITSGFGSVGVAPGTEGAARWALVQENNWKFDKFLDRFRRDMLEMFALRGFNWPTVPLQHIKDIDYVKKLYTALLVMFVRQQDSVESTYKWEKEFIQLSSTMRGKNLMIGKSGLKPDLQLPLPSSVLLNTKNALLGHFAPPPEPEPEPVAPPKRKRKPAPPPVIHQRKPPGTVGGIKSVKPVEVKEVVPLTGLMRMLAGGDAKKSTEPPRLSTTGALAPVKTDRKLALTEKGRPSTTGATASAATTTTAAAAAELSDNGSISSKSKAIKGKKKGLRLKDIVGGDLDPQQSKQALQVQMAESSRVARTSSPGKSMTRRNTDNVPMLLAPLKR